LSKSSLVFNKPYNSSGAKQIAKHGRQSINSNACADLNRTCHTIDSTYAMRFSWRRISERLARRRTADTNNTAVPVKMLRD
jgi:hypothetical protein